MGRKNPFIFKYTKNKLLLLTDLQGQIGKQTNIILVHVSGRTKIINKTPRTLLHKNFFKDLLSQQTKSHLY
jgi:hypothetical protein